ncbi:MAG: hypothetical protein GY870_09215 [archaeon]|nr:hypothetical protein [archaeon]
MTDKEWYLLCIDRKISFLLAHQNYNREFYEVEYCLNEIKKEVFNIFKRFIKR